MSEQLNLGSSGVAASAATTASTIESKEQPNEDVKTTKRSMRSSRIAAAALGDPNSQFVDLSASQNSQGEQRRHSTRSVKRRKFDDELVESSLNNKQEKIVKTMNSKSTTADRVTPEPSKPTESTELSLSASQTSLSGRTTRSTATAAAPQPPPPVTPPTAAASTSAATPEAKPSTSQASKTTEKKKATTKSTSKSKVKKPKKVPFPAQASALKDLGRWKPQDDLLLLEAVQQTSDMKCVHVGVKFSCNFSLREIEDRWYTLLYNEKISKVAMTAIQQLPYDEIMRIQSKALYSKQEEDILSTITVSSQPAQATFSELLKTHIGKFHKSRTSKSLQEHWTLMKQYHLLPDQSVQPLPKGDHILNFSDAEELIDDKQLKEPLNPSIAKEAAMNDRKQKKEIRNLEQELPKWQVLVESVTGNSQPDFDNQTLAILRGRLVRYLMRSKEISIGRTTKDNQVDVDLSLEGPSFKISRRQGAIKLRNSGEFILINNGKRPMYVDSKPVMPNAKLKLHNNSVIEITCLRFIFLINQDLIRGIKSEAQKTSSSTS